MNAPAQSLVVLLCGSSAICWIAAGVWRWRRNAAATDRPESARRAPIEAWAVIAAVLWVGMSLGQQVASLVHAPRTEPAAVAPDADQPLEAARETDEFDPQEVLSRLRGACLEQSLLLVMLLCLMTRWSRRSLSEFGIVWRPVGRQCAAGLVAVTLAWLPVFLVLFATYELGLRTEERAHSVLRMLSAEPSWETWLWAIVSAVLFAPIVEELLFRVILQSWLVQQLGLASGLMLSAILFATVHTFPDSLAIIPLALVLGYSYHRQFSFVAIVVAHALFNGTMLVLSALLVGE